MAKRRSSKASKRVVLDTSLGAFPHNGEGRPELQFPDPVNGDVIGGQEAAMRMTMRYRHCVFPWARRQGKTKRFQFVHVNESAITPGEYYAGITYPDHTTAYKIADDFIRSYGGLVKDFRNPPDHQDRWIELLPNQPPAGIEAPTWFTEPMKERWYRCRDGDPKKDKNTRIKIYLWSTVQYEKIQGFPHHFNRIDHDECQQSDPRMYGIVRPMTRDAIPGLPGVRCHESWSGTPWHTGPGNAKFEEFWDIAGDPVDPRWFRMRVPDGTIPPWIVPRVTHAEMRSMTEAEIRQTLYAEFLKGEGAVFSNLVNVFVLEPISGGDASLDWVRALRTRLGMPTTQWWVYKPEPVEGHVYGASVDWARSPTGDYSVLSIMDFTTTEQHALLRWRGEDFTAQMEMVLAVCEHYGAKQLHSDDNGMGMTMSDFMRKRHAKGFVAHRFGKNKQDYVRRGQILCSDADVALINCHEQLTEFKNFSMVVGGKSLMPGDTLSAEKQVKYEAAPGHHDDTVAAFLQIAQTLTIVGRQAAREDEPPPPPMFDEHWQTTLELFTEGEDLPYHEPTDEITWDSIVVPG